VATKQGFALWRATGTFFRGAGKFVQGRRDEALPLLINGIDAFRGTGAELTLTFQLGTLGDAYTQAGQFNEARESLNLALAIAQKNDELCHEAELHRLTGELLLAEAPEQVSAAEECFLLAIDTARRQKSKGWELRAAMSLARLWLREGRRGKGYDLLAAIAGTYTEGLTTPDLVEATTLLEALA
jgi:predicted ATPase